MENNNLPKAPEPVQPNDPQEPVTPAPDLMTRVNQYKPAPVTQNQNQNDPQIPFNYNDFDKITTIEQAKEWAMNSHKSMESGYNKKYENVADLRKELESQKSTLQEQVKWTPEKIKQLTSNEQFIQAAQQFSANNQPNPQSSGMTDDEWSGLSDAEQGRFNRMEQMLSQQNQQMNQMLESKEDEQLSGRYANFDPKIVNQIQQGLLTGSIQPTRELLWKVYDYDNLAQRVYDLAKAEIAQQNAEKANAINPLTNQGSFVNPTDAPPVKDKGKSSAQHFIDIAMSNLVKHRAGQ